MAMNQKMKTAREEKGLSLQQLAEAAGVSADLVEEIELGMENPSVEVCRAICRVLGQNLNDLFWDDGEKLPDAEKKVRRFLPKNAAFYAEPEGGINDPREFTDELCNWAAREHHDLEILENSMEPRVIVDGVEYTCILGDAGRPPLEHSLLKMLHLPQFNHSVGGFMGYKWIFFYRNEK